MMRVEVLLTDTDGGIQIDTDTVTIGKDEDATVLERKAANMIRKFVQDAIENLERGEHT